MHGGSSGLPHFNNWYLKQIYPLCGASHGELSVDAIDTAQSVGVLG